MTETITINEIIIVHGTYTFNPPLTLTPKWDAEGEHFVALDESLGLVAWGDNLADLTSEVHDQLQFLVRDYVFDKADDLEPESLTLRTNWAARLVKVPQ